MHTCIAPQSRIVVRRLAVGKRKKSSARLGAWGTAPLIYSVVASWWLGGCAGGGCAELGMMDAHSEQQMWMLSRRVRREIFGQTGSDDESDDGRDMSSGRIAARRALAAQAAPDNADGPRERALRALAETAEAMHEMRFTRQTANAEALALYHIGEDAESPSGLLRLFWAENSRVLIAGARDSVRAAKREAVKALRFLAHDPHIGSLLWMDEHGARAALLAGAAAGSGQDEDVRWSAHSAISLIACSESCATQIWQHAATRQVVLSTVRRAGRQAVLRIRLEAFDTIINSITCGSASVLQALWVSSASEDVRAAVMTCLGDDAEGEPIKLKALAVMAAAVKQGGAEAARRVLAEELARGTKISSGEPPRYTFMLTSLADCAEASGLPVRHAALRLLCATYAHSELHSLTESDATYANGASKTTLLAEVSE